MQKLELEQKLGQKLSGQQIQFAKLLQVPSMMLNDYIAKEIADNPLLDDAKKEEDNRDISEEALIQTDADHTFYETYKKHPTIDRYAVYQQLKPHTISLQENLKEQLSLLYLNEVEYRIGEQIIGSIDQNGYLQCGLEIIVQDLYVNHYLEVSIEMAQKVLLAVQSLEPAGIACRNLQECLLIQLNKQGNKNPVIQLAKEIVTHCFDSFTKKHYEAIIKKLMLPNTVLLKKALTHISRLNPRPGWDHGTIESSNHFLTPDFIVVEYEGKLSVDFFYYPTYQPRFNRNYLSMLEAYEKKIKKTKADQEMIVFLKKKKEDAKWFIDAIAQRKQTLLKTMMAIFELQHKFFLGEEELDQLVPMVLQHVADKIGMDASTVSRIVNQKSVQGKFGIYPLKFFFSEGIKKSNGEHVSNKAVKQRIVELMQHEDKQNPYTDEQLVTILTEEGYHVARRTVAKYREQLNMPVARLRKTPL